ncbi:MAG: damage-inducible protein DinB [Methylocystaceae bacterium]|nr:MAG: damage-inducible protein DinB [Methylocystaceae bacterium]
MITPAFAQKMARYNRWQNGSLYAAADALSDEARRADRGAFFKSIHGTLNHLLWADAMWMSRIADAPKPTVALRASHAFRADWTGLKEERAAMDERLVGWADGLDETALEGDLSWFSGAKQADIVMARKLIVVHVFNHQTHHRGQVHAMLTAAGAKPEDTDLIFM